MAELPEIIVGEAPPRGARTLEEAGFSKQDTERLIKMTNAACMQISFGLPKQAEELFPPSIPLFAVDPGDAGVSNAEGVSFMQHSFVSPIEAVRAMDEGRISDLQHIEFKGIALRLPPGELVAQERYARSIVIHEILHPMFETAIGSSKSVKETAIFALQRACGAQNYLPPEVRDKVAPHQDQTYGFRTDDFAHTRDSVDISSYLYLYAAAAANGAPSDMIADVCTQLALKAKKARRIVTFKELSDAFMQAGHKGEKLLGTLPFKPMRTGLQCYTVLSSEQDRAFSSFVDVRKNPDYLQPFAFARDASVQYLVDAPAGDTAAHIELEFDFGYFGTIGFSRDTAPVALAPGRAPMLTTSTGEAIEMLLHNGSDLFRQLEHEHGSKFGMEELVRITHRFADGQEFSLKPTTKHTHE